jgi:hypothetical protein
MTASHTINCKPERPGLTQDVLICLKCASSEKLWADCDIACVKDDLSAVAGTGELHVATCTSHDLQCTVHTVLTRFMALSLRRSTKMGGL